MFPLGALLDIGGKILDKVFPDPAQAVLVAKGGNETTIGR